MNDQYQYLGRHLVPSIAQKLIQALFAGQTVQRQRIIRKMNEVHMRQGGLPPRATACHPAENALSNMKRLGLAENPERGIWYILPVESSRGYATREHPLIKTLDQFIKWTKECSRGEYVFRGVPNSEYGIQASAYRRPEEKKRNFEKHLQINRDLIREARLRGFDEKDGRVLKQLEILADLQHFGAATCLIDFTYNAQISLRFACEDDPKNSQSIRDGKVFAVRNYPPKFKEITPALLQEDIDYFLKDGEESQLYHWSPRQQNPRIIIQQSIFLFGKYEFDADKVCIIAAERKQEILEELEQASNITEDRLFPDFAGFARVRREEVPYTELTASEYRWRGYQSYSKGDYRDAISDFDRAFSLNGGNHEIYYFSGKAKYELKQYSGAIDDFTEAIRLKSDEPEYYFMQGLARSKINQTAEAKESFNNAINLRSDDSRFYKWKAEICSLLGEYEEAIDCYNRAIDYYNLTIDYYVRDTDSEFSRLSDIFYWRGMTKFNASRYPEAIDDFTEAISLDPHNPDYYIWRSRSKEQAEVPESGNSDLKIALRIAIENGAIDVINSYKSMFHTIDFDTLISDLSSAK